LTFFYFTPHFIIFFDSANWAIKMQMEFEQNWIFPKKNVLSRKFAQTGKLAGSSTSSSNFI